MSNHPTPNDMRKRLLEVGCMGISLTEGERNSISAGACIVRAVNNLADASGLSGEDRYTLMAYHLLEALERNTRMALDMMSGMPPRPIVLACEHKKTRAINPDDNVPGAHLQCLKCGRRRTKEGWL